MGMEQIEMVLDNLFQFNVINMISFHNNLRDKYKINVQYINKKLDINNIPVNNKYILREGYYTSSLIIKDGNTLKISNPTYNETKDIFLDKTDVKFSNIEITDNMINYNNEGYISDVIGKIYYYCNDYDKTKDSTYYVIDV